MVAARRDPVMRRWLRHAVTTNELSAPDHPGPRADRQPGTGFSFAVLQADPGAVAGDLVGGVTIRAE
jgi:hypothetical protein